MERRFLIPIALGTAAILAAVAVLFAIGTVRASATGVLPSGRTVAAHANSFYLGCEFQGDTAIIRTAFDTVVVKPDRVERGDETIALLDASAKSVEVRFENGATTVVADGKPAARPAR